MDRVDFAEYHPLGPAKRFPLPGWVLLSVPGGEMQHALILRGRDGGGGAASTNAPRHYALVLALALSRSILHALLVYCSTKKLMFNSFKFAVEPHLIWICIGLFVGSIQLRTRYMTNRIPYLYSLHILTIATKHDAWNCPATAEPDLIVVEVNQDPTPHYSFATHASSI